MVGRPADEACWLPRRVVYLPTTTSACEREKSTMWFPPQFRRYRHQMLVSILVRGRMKRANLRNYQGYRRRNRSSYSGQDPAGGQRQRTCDARSKSSSGCVLFSVRIEWRGPSEATYDERGGAGSCRRSAEGTLGKTEEGEVRKEVDKCQGPGTEFSRPQARLRCPAPPPHFPETSCPSGYTGAGMPRFCGRFAA